MRSWADLTEAEQIAAGRLYSQRRDYAIIHQQYDIAPNQEENVNRKVREIAHILEASERHPPRTPRAKTPRYNRPMQVKGDALLLFDIHAPFHDGRWIDRCIDLAKSWSVRQCILGGDVADFNAFSPYGADLGIDAEQELDTLAELVDGIVDAFDMTFIFSGNHDVRPLRLLQNKIGIKRIMQLFTPSGKVQISDYFWCELQSGGKEFYIEHPKNTSIIPGRVPSKLAEKYHKHIIAGHGHTWGMSQDTSGKYICIDSGVCCDSLRLAYIAQRHNTRPQLVKGAVIVKQGNPTLLSEHNISYYEEQRWAR